MMIIKVFSLLCYRQSGTVRLQNLHCNSICLPGICIPSRYCSTAVNSNHIHSHINSKYEIDSRMMENSSSHIKKTNERWEREKRHCSRCFLLNEHCICKQIDSLWSMSPSQSQDNRATKDNDNMHCNENPRLHPRLQLYLFTHYKEYGKSSNTGKLLNNIPAIGAGTGCQHSKVCIYGSQHDEEVIYNLLHPKVNELTLLLYPGVESVSIDVAKGVLAQSGVDGVGASNEESTSNLNSNNGTGSSNNSSDNSDSSSIGNSNGNGVNISSHWNAINFIVIDSTWAQSKAMYRWACRQRKVGHNNTHSSGSGTGVYVNIHSNEAVLSRGASLFENRKQIAPTKSSTLESTVVSLEYLDLCNHTFLQYCYKSLSISVEAMKRQNGKY